MALIPSSSQTVGPFYAIGLDHLTGERVPLVPQSAAHEVTITGSVVDGNGVPVPDAFLEVWQADATGRYARETDLFDLATTAGFPGFLRVPLTAEGTFRFTTAVPGTVPYDSDHPQAPHLLVLIFMRGLLRNLVTRMYFPGNDEALAADPVLQLLPESRRASLIAEVTQAGLHWPIRLRGEGETVFFAW